MGDPGCLWDVFSLFEWLENRRFASCFPVFLGLALANFGREHGGTGICKGRGLPQCLLDKTIHLRFGSRHCVAEGTFMIWGPCRSPWIVKLSACNWLASPQKHEKPCRLSQADNSRKPQFLLNTVRDNPLPHSPQQLKQIRQSLDTDWPWQNRSEIASASWAMSSRGTKQQGTGSKGSRQRSKQRKRPVKEETPEEAEARAWEEIKQEVRDVRQRLGKVKFIKKYHCESL